MRLTKALATALILMAIIGTANAATASSISQYGIGITWAFDKEHEFGQFVNGDYWVKGPVTIVSISPSSTEIAGRVMNGSMINPNGDNDHSGADESNKHGFDSLAGGFDSSLNVARPGGNDLTAGNPLVIEAGTSLVSSKSFAADKGGSAQIEDFAILTVLSTAPSANSFRPAYASTDKTIKYNLTDIDFEALSDLAIAGSNAPALSKVVEWFKYPCIAIAHDGTGTEIGGNRCSQHDDYTEQIGKAALLLNSNFTDAEKQAPLIHILQNGIDRHGVLTNGGRKLWRGNGAFHMGIKLTILFTAKVLGDNEMLSDISSRSGDYWESAGYGRKTWPTITRPPDLYYFSEDTDTVRISSWDILSAPYQFIVKGDRTTRVGNVKVTNGSKTVIGVGTSFLNGKHEKFGEFRNEECGIFTYGAWFAIPTDNQAYSATGKAYDIEEFVSNTEITLKEPYSGNTDQTGTLTYAISSVIYYGHGADGISNPPNCYRGRDFNEISNSYLNWPDWINYYIGGKANGVATDTFSIGYRGNTGRNYGSQALPALIMGLKQAWNHDVFFDYTDRYIAWAREEGREDFQGGRFVGDMWKAYRANYSCVWKEEGEGPYYDCSGCLYDCLAGPYCGDGSCNGTENSASCSYDCGECEEGTTRQCGTTSAGECEYGTQTCVGKAWGPCTGAILPAAEQCTGSKDEDCDSLTDCADSDCLAAAECTTECTTDSDCPTGQTCQNSVCTAECIDEVKLSSNISEWKQGRMTMQALMQKMKQWKAGTGCP